MRVTDEMVEAAWGTLCKHVDPEGWPTEAEVRFALEAALAAAPQAASPSDADRDYADMQRMQAALIAKTHECIELRVRNAAALHAVERVAREAEREACARVCEETTAAWTQPVYNSACMDCATAIRNRSEGER